MKRNGPGVAVLRVWTAGGAANPIPPPGPGPRPPAAGADLRWSERCESRSILRLTLNKFIFCLS